MTPILKQFSIILPLKAFGLKSSLLHEQMKKKLTVIIRVARVEIGRLV